MSSLADKIEQYIKILIERSESGSIEIQRLELAETFSCAPSQITYVIATRFSPRYGFYAESKRGGSGYVRVSRIQPDHLTEWLEPAEAGAILQGLLEEGKLSFREFFLLKAIVDTLGDSPELTAAPTVIGRVVQTVARLLK